MTLREKRCKFTHMIALLILHAEQLGYEISIDKVKGSTNNASSLHLDGLAADMNLYLFGQYLTKTEDHAALGEYWESIGGSWGGRFEDGNHYSLAHRGMR